MVKKMKFKPRELVVVNPNLVVFNYYEGVIFTPNMGEFRGRVVTINHVLIDGNSNAYTIDELDSYRFTEKMLLNISEAFIPDTAVKYVDDSPFSNGDTILHVGHVMNEDVWFKETNTYLPLGDKTLKVIEIPDIVGISCDHPKKIKDNEKNENRLQNEEGLGRNGSYPTVCRVCRRGHQVTISVGRLSNQARPRTSPTAVD